MYKYFVTLETGYVGSTAYDLFESKKELSEDSQAEIAWEMAVDNAASYGYELCSDDCEDDECEYEHPGCSNICGSMEPYIPEKHDMYLY